MDIFSANSFSTNSDDPFGTGFSSTQATIRFMLTSQTVEAQKEVNSEEVAGYNGLLLTLALVLGTCLCIFVYKYVARLRIFYEASARMRSPQIPCSRCRFFNPSPHLKCAVHPTKVLTTKAINCSDQWLKGSDEFSFKESHVDE